jgi:very-short-patch-repair endonuclease
MRPETERAVWDLARRQQGVVTRDQVLAAGWSPGALRRLVRTGLLRELFPRAYIVGPGEPPGAREKAALLVAGEGALLSHQTAAVQWGFMPPATGVPIHVMLVGTGRGRICGLHTHRVTRLEPEERSERAGLPLTSPARTLLDLAAVVGRRELEQILAGLERARVLPATAWPGLLDRYQGRPGVAALRSAMEIPGGPAFTRSEAENAFLELARRSTLPPPEANVAVGPWEIDFLWRSERVAVEVDGYEYHRTRGDFERDRAKGAWLTARGFRVIRLSWRQIREQPMATAVLLGQALVRR